MSTPTPTILSGIKPSGQPTLGNYLGAYLPFSRFLAKRTHNVFMMVADHHAITVRQDPKELTENTYAIAAWYIASGLNPDDCTLFVQSHVPEHAQLGWILTTFTQMGELARMTQYKDKSKGENEAVGAGLFMYPSLMAADILLYDTTEVPVGDDQTQHVELCRDIATRMNNLYGPDTFVLPKAVKPVAAQRVRDLQNPLKKMSKSEAGEGGCIMLEDETSAITKKIKRAVTDTLAEVAYDPANQPGLANLIEILAACSHRTPKEVVKEFKGSQYGPLKGAVAEAVVQTLEPVQAEYAKLMADKAELQNILAKGAKKAREKAAQTLGRVMTKVGYVLPR
ncbi:MAG: tryptophan--tRNA ligase [Pseudomonadaceae bacterium]|nr:tryptophan--tRNA ligase [Pseudomonadaceae bacterium]